MRDCSCESHSIVSQCKACSECGWADYLDASGNWSTGCSYLNQVRLDQTQKIIQGVVRVPSSEYAMNRAAANVFQTNPRRFGLGRMYADRSTQSDRKSFHRVKESEGVFRHSSSSRASKTRGWPGHTSAPGVGVDVKHGSYARYLARKKGHVLRAGIGAYEFREDRVPTYDQILKNPRLTKGGKNVKFSIISAPGCQCETLKEVLKRDEENDCCQEIDVGTTSPAANVGDKVTGANSGASGTVVAVNDTDQAFPVVTITLDDCDTPFTATDNGNIVIGGILRLLSVVLTESTICN